MLFVCTATFFLCIKQFTVSPRFVYHKAVERESVRAYVKSQKQAIRVTLKCANNCSGWLVPPVWCHPTDERLLAAVRMYAVLSVKSITAKRIWQPARWKTHHFREGTRPTEFPPARRHPYPPWGGGFSAASPLFFFLFLIASSLEDLLCSSS